MTRLSAGQRLDQALARIADPCGEGQRCFTRLYEERARAEAQAADARARLSVSLGPLDGVIVSIKDLFGVAGEPTMSGSPSYANAPPEREDAVILRRLRQAGVVVIGKTNMTELAFSGIGINRHFGTPGNAADRARIPGGSSSGAAVSCADGMCEIAIGSDTGGSVRVPAALNGLVGFKPTKARVPLGGAMPLSWSLDSIGPLTRSVRDAAAADAVMAGEAARPLTPRPLRGMRLGVPRGRLLDGLDAAVAAAFEAALAALGAAGATLIDCNLEPHLERIDDFHAEGTIAAVEAAAAHAGVLAAEPQTIDPFVVRRIAANSRVSGARFARMLEERRIAVALAREALTLFDAVIMPTTPVVAPLRAPLMDDFDMFIKTNTLVLRNCAPFNILDCCGISLPLAGAGPLPVGLQLVGAQGSDHVLLDVAAGVEALVCR